MAKENKWFELDEDLQGALWVGAYANQNIAVGIDSRDEDGFEEDYGMLTVNLGEALPQGWAYLDTNNIPNALEIAQDYCQFTGMYGNSGFCQYPLVVFDLAALEAVAFEFQYFTGGVVE